MLRTGEMVALVIMPACIPTNVAAMARLVLLGGTMSANDEYQWIEDEIRLIRKAVDKNLPIMGHC